ncbi:MAG TPA: glycosyltransferase family 4 protein [Verrucomicrobiota bacterium]|nr:glycosyltransferase family 4 protein [Verrucomicrobiota bacterium]
MKILHLNNEKSWRGGERQTLLLAAGLRDRGVHSVIGCRPDGLLEAQAHAASVETLPIAGNNFGAALALVRAARRFDLIHCHTGRGHSLAAITSGVHGKPFVATRRVDFLPGNSAFNRFKFRKAERVVCISRFIEKQLSDWGVPTQKLSVIRSAVPIPAPSDDRTRRAREWRATLGISPQTKLVGNIGALVGHKDHATLLRAAKEIRTRRQDVAFVIIGEGELKDRLLKLRQELGLTEAVHFTGFLPRAEELLPAFDVFAMSSCMEGLGSIVLDAFAAGVPVAATAGGGLPELVRNDQTGLLGPVGDAPAFAASILRLLDEESLRERLSTSARAWLEEDCSVASMTSGYLEIYGSILK